MTHKKNKKFHLRKIKKDYNHEINQTNNITIPIKGMHCRSCELLVEETLKEIPEVNDVFVSYKQKQAVLSSSETIPPETLQTAVEKAGYEIGFDSTKDWISLNLHVWKDAGVALLILTALYFLARQFGLFNLKIGSTSNPSNLAVVLVIGLTAGFSTCMALIGGLILGISAKFSEKHPEATSTQKFRPHLFFNLGRIASYFLLGGIIGLIGKVFQLSAGITGTLLIFAGIAMLIVGAQLTELFPRLGGLSFSMPASISKLFGIRKHHEKEYSHVNSVIVGALTFFVPCGFTQAMQLYAVSTGNFWSGAFIMATFAVGTAPGLLGIGGLTSVVKGVFARRFFKGAGILVIALAVFNISNGLNLSGLSTKFSNTFQRSGAGNTALAKDDPNVKFVDGVQIVSMNQNSNGYSPNKFTIKKGIPVKWIINSLDSGSCAASIYSQKLGIRKLLKDGENVIEFIPTEIGVIPFSCSMGMYRGSFTVIENNSPSSNESSPKSTTASGSENKNNAPSSTSVPLQNGSIQEASQIISATYTNKDDIIPKRFTIKANESTRFKIDPQDDGQGCMSSVALPNLVDDFQVLERGKPIIFNFTAKPGKYYVTCAMGTQRAVITVE